MSMPPCRQCPMSPRRRPPPRCPTAALLWSLQLRPPVEDISCPAPPLSQSEVYFTLPMAHSQVLTSSRRPAALPAVNSSVFHRPSCYPRTRYDMTLIQVSNTCLFAPAGTCCAVPSCTSQSAQDEHYAGTDCQSATPRVSPTSGAPGRDIIVAGSSLPPCRYNTIKAQNDPWNPQDFSRPRRSKTSSGPRGGPGKRSLSHPASPANAFGASFPRFPYSLESFPWKVFPKKVFPWKVFPLESFPLERF
jgi:hypothetical protein